jgi:Mrp family chromosome partitioning ATPase
LQARPIIDLADRLEADARQTTSHTLAFVSIGPSRGAPQTLVHAGTLLAERRHADVLLVDADLSHRALTQALDAQGQPGLAEALLRHDSGLCLQLATPYLQFLPAGLQPQLDAAAAESPLEALFQTLGQQYGVVLIDGGQAGGPFASTLARQADATYLVVELGAVEAPQAQEALRDLRAAGARVLGCIAT